MKSALFIVHLLVGLAHTSCALRARPDRTLHKHVPSYVHQKIDKTCPRFARVKMTYQGIHGGCGHLFADIVFGIDIAVQLNATYVYDDLSDPSYSPETWGMYPPVFRYLNLGFHEHTLQGIRQRYAPTEIETSLPDASRHLEQCNVMVTVDDMYCTHPSGVGTLDCFEALKGVFNRVKNVMRSKYRLSSAAKKLSATLFREHDAFNVAWHIRSGDISLHQGDVDYFTNIHTQLTNAFRNVGVRPRHYIFSNSDGTPPGFEFLEKLHNVVITGRVGVIETLHHFAHADMVVETGSSFTTIAHTITDAPLFLYGCPKEGCGVTTYDVSELIKLDANGTLQITQSQIQSAIANKYISNQFL